MFQATDRDLTNRQIIEKLEQVLVEYAAKYGLTVKAREAMRFSIAQDV